MKEHKTSIHYQYFALISVIIEKIKENLMLFMSEKEVIDNLINIYVTITSYNRKNTCCSKNKYEYSMKQ